MSMIAPKEAREANVKPAPDQRSNSVNKCNYCGRMFKDGETCPKGGCPMGGDF